METGSCAALRWNVIHHGPIQENSSLGARLLSDPPVGHLLGDAGCPLHPYMLTPFRAREGGFEHLTRGKHATSSRRRRRGSLLKVSMEPESRSLLACKARCDSSWRLTSILILNACAMLWNLNQQERDAGDGSRELHIMEKQLMLETLCEESRQGCVMMRAVAH